jgi:hypothetical protein
MASRGEKTARYETLILAIVLAIGAAFLVSFARGLGTRTETPAEDVRPDADAPANLDERRVGRVEVLNGTRVAGIARVATQQLRDAGFDVVHFGNADGIDADSSVVYSRISNDEIAKAAAAALGITRVVLQPDTSLYVDASVVLGADWRPVNSTRAR